MKSAQYKAARRCSPVADADKTMGTAHDQALSNVDYRLRNASGHDPLCCGRLWRSRRAWIPGPGREVRILGSSWPGMRLTAQHAMQRRENYP